MRQSTANIQAAPATSVTVAAYAVRDTRTGDIAEAAGIERAGLRDLFVDRTAPFAERFPHLAAAAGAFATDPERNFGDAIGHVIAEILRPPRPPR